MRLKPIGRIDLLVTHHNKSAKMEFNSLKKGGSRILRTNMIRIFNVVLMIRNTDNFPNVPKLLCEYD